MKQDLSFLPSSSVVIRPSRGWRALNLKELWYSRELILFLAWRILSVRYKQTVLGAAWVILQPLLTMLVFTIIFGRLVQVPSDGFPYPLFAYAGLVPWQLFAYCLTESSNSLVANQDLITKVYFPRLVMPLANALAGLFDFAITFLVLLGLMVFYHIPVSGHAWAVPLFVLLALVGSLGVGIWLAALNVRYRDVRYTLPFLTQFWLLVTPIAYPSSLVPAHWRVFYGLNPMAGAVEGFRWALLSVGGGPDDMLFVSLLTALGLLISGIYYFRRMEGTFADSV